LPSELHPVAGIHRCLSGDPPGLLAQRASARGIIIGLVLPEDEFRSRLRLLGNDLLVFGKFRLPADAAVCGIIDLRLGRGPDLIVCSEIGNR
jgi:hypothetical protein